MMTDLDTAFQEFVASTGCHIRFREGTFFFEDASQCVLVQIEANSEYLYATVDGMPQLDPTKTVAEHQAANVGPVLKLLKRFADLRGLALSASEDLDYDGNRRSLNHLVNG